MHRHHMKCIAFSFVNFHLMSVTIFREIISHCGDGNSTKMYPAEVKTELWGFITFHDTMKTHEIIENDCEDFMWALVTKLKLIYNNMKDLKQLRDQRPHTSLRRPRPFSHQKVTMGGHFPSCFRKYPHKSNQVYMCSAHNQVHMWSALSNHMW